MACVQLLTTTLGQTVALPANYQPKGRVPNFLRESLAGFVLREMICLSPGYSGIKMVVLMHSLN